MDVDWLQNICLFKSVLIGGPVGPLPPICFSSENSSLVDPLYKFWWCYGQTALPKSRLANFWCRAPLNADPNHRRNRRDHGRISEPPTMESFVSAMLEHHKFPGWYSNIAQFFVSASPAVRSDARALKTSFFTMVTMINSAVRNPPQKQRCQHLLAGDDALTTTAGKGRDDVTLMTMAGDQHNNQHFVVGAVKARPFVASEKEAARRASEERTRGRRVRPTKVGNAIMTGIGSRQNPHTP